MRCKTLVLFLALIATSHAYAVHWFGQSEYQCKDFPNSYLPLKLRGGFNLFIQSYNEGDFVVHQWTASNDQFLTNSFNRFNKAILSWESIYIETGEDWVLQRVHDFNWVRFRIEEDTKLVLNLRHENFGKMGLVSFSKVCSLIRRDYSVFGSQFDSPPANLPKRHSSMYFVESKDSAFFGNPNFKGAIPQRLLLSNVTKKRGRPKKNRDAIETQNVRIKKEEPPAKMPRRIPAPPVEPDLDSEEVREMNSFLSVEEMLALFDADQNYQSR